jgi:hypothetical protein
MQKKVLMELNFWCFTFHYEAAMEENKKLGLRSAMHHAQMDVARWNVLHSARPDLLQHGTLVWFTRSIIQSQSIQNIPLDYNYANEMDRFEEAGKLWKQAAPHILIIGIK